MNAIRRLLLLFISLFVILNIILYILSGEMLFFTLGYAQNVYLDGGYSYAHRTDSIFTSYT